MSKELEILGLLQEECAEVIQIASKIRRFGMESTNPYDPVGKNNRTLLQDEIGDVKLIISLLQEMKSVDQYQIQHREIWKRGKLQEHGIIPKPDKTFLEAMSALTLPDEVWEEMETRKRRENIMWEVIETVQQLPVEGSQSKRKYLLRKAAELLTEIENLPDESFSDED
jgi:hypothetical protein